MSPFQPTVPLRAGNPAGDPQHIQDNGFVGVGGSTTASGQHLISPHEYDQTPKAGTPAQASGHSKPPPLKPKSSGGGRKATNAGATKKRARKRQKRTSTNEDGSIDDAGNGGGDSDSEATGDERPTTYTDGRIRNNHSAKRSRVRKLMIIVDQDDDLRGYGYNITKLREQLEACKTIIINAGLQHQLPQDFKMWVKPPRKGSEQWYNVTEARKKLEAYVESGELVTVGLDFAEAAADLVQKRTGAAHKDEVTKALEETRDRLEKTNNQENQLLSQMEEQAKKIQELERKLEETKTQKETFESLIIQYEQQPAKPFADGVAEAAGNQRRPGIETTHLPHRWQKVQSSSRSEYTTEELLSMPSVKRGLEYDSDDGDIPVPRKEALPVQNLKAEPPASNIVPGVHNTGQFRLYTHSHSSSTPGYLQTQPHMQQALMYQQQLQQHGGLLGGFDNKHLVSTFRVAPQKMNQQQQRFNAMNANMWNNLNSSSAPAATRMFTGFDTDGLAHGLPSLGTTTTPALDPMLYTVGSGPSPGVSGIQLQLQAQQQQQQFQAQQYQHRQQLQTPVVSPAPTPEYPEEGLVHHDGHGTGTISPHLLQQDQHQHHSPPPVVGEKYDDNLGFEVPDSIPTQEAMTAFFNSPEQQQQQQRQQQEMQQRQQARLTEDVEMPDNSHGHASREHGGFNGRPLWNAPEDDMIFSMSP